MAVASLDFQSEERKSFGRSLGASLALHLAALFVFWLGWHFAPAPQVANEPLVIEVEPLPKSKIRKRMVQTEKGQETKNAPDTAFLGERNQRVDRETVGPTGEIRSGESGAKSNERSESKARKQSQPKAASKVATAAPLAKFGLTIMPRPQAAVQKPEDPQWATPGARPEDNLTDVNHGERTALNTREFVYYGYYQRIRERLDRAWVPLLREKVMGMYRKGRMLASDHEHMTRILVVLNGHGEIVKVNLVDDSGTQELDDAAIGAFNQAGPFPNPPRGMIDANGEIRIPWDFVLKT